MPIGASKVLVNPPTGGRTFYKNSPAATFVQKTHRDQTTFMVIMAAGLLPDATHVLTISASIDVNGTTGPTVSKVQQNAGGNKVTIPMVIFVSPYADYTPSNSGTGTPSIAIEEVFL